MNDPFLNAVALAAGCVIGWLMFLKPLLDWMAGRAERRQRINEAIEKAWCAGEAEKIAKYLTPDRLDYNSLKQRLLLNDERAKRQLAYEAEYHRHMAEYYWMSKAKEDVEAHMGKETATKFPAGS